MTSKALLKFTPSGIYCEQADVFIDPWRRVKRALITHAHSDHARWGMEAYLAHNHSIPVMRLRLGKDIRAQGIEYNQSIRINGVEISFHPAGHIIGSSQIRLAYQDQIWVVSGDYKVEDDGLATAFEPITCTHFITESTFGLPVYRWSPQEEVFSQINDWWASNAAVGRPSLITAYSLGKAQRILQGVDHEIGPVFTHGAVENTNEVLRKAGIQLKASRQVIGQGPDAHKKKDFQNALIIAPPSAVGSAWVKRFGTHSLGMASGWMSLRGARRRRAADRGFILSDHADWDGLNWAVQETGAEYVYVTHGYSEIYSRWLREQGYKSQVVETLFGEEEEQEPSPTLDQK
ncbi:MAG: ligase-associated DNA damage response exonuclease [Bacteroidia bacterium]|nr:ligase-associated DNA damage response exonuclease [Bacteroidia bacterium]